MTTFGSRFKELRLLLNLSQEEIGKTINATKSYISLVERDKNKLSADSFQKLLFKHNVNLNYLIGGVGSPFVEQKNENIKEEILIELEKILTQKGIT